MQLIQYTSFFNKLKSFTHTKKKTSSQQRKMQRCLFSCDYWENYKLLSEKSSKQFLQTIITKVIPNNAFKLFQMILSIYYQRNHFKQFLHTIIREIIQTILTNYYHRNHSKQFLQTITREIIPKNAYSLWQRLQTMLKTINGKLMFIF